MYLAEQKVFQTKTKTKQNTDTVPDMHVWITMVMCKNRASFTGPKCVWFFAGTLKK